METREPWTLGNYRFTGRFTRYLEAVLPNGSRRRHTLIGLVVAGLIALALWGGGV